MTGENEMPREIVEKVRQAAKSARDELEYFGASEDFTRSPIEAALAALSPDDLKGLLEHATGKRVVEVDPCFADWRPPCVDCGEPVDFPDALLLPAARYSEDEADTITIAHKRCPVRSALASPREQTG